MICFELTPDQNTWFLNFKDQFKEHLRFNNIDVIPIQIKNGNYVLSYKIINDQLFEPLKTALDAGGHFGNVIVREVQENEFIEIQI